MLLEVTSVKAINARQEAESHSLRDQLEKTRDDLDKAHRKLNALAGAGCLITTSL